MAKKSSKVKPVPVEPMTTEQVESQPVQQVGPVTPLKPGKRPAFLQGQKTGQFVATREFSESGDSPEGKGATTKFDTPRAGNTKHICKIYED